MAAVNKDKDRGKVVSQASSGGGNISKLVIQRNGCIFYFSQTLDFFSIMASFFWSIAVSGLADRVSGECSKCLENCQGCLVSFGLHCIIAKL